MSFRSWKTGGKGTTRPAIDLIAQGNFLQKWEEINPWTAKNIAGLRESVSAIDNKGESFA